MHGKAGEGGREAPYLINGVCREVSSEAQVLQVYTFEDPLEVISQAVKNGKNG